MENWCEKHQAQWFKKGKMKGYAHPIGDTGQWCNMSEEEAAHPSTYESPPKPEARKPSGEEVGMWYKELGFCLRSGYIENKALEIAYKTQMLSVLDITIEKK